MLLLASPSFAEVPALAPFNFKVRYDVYWNSLPLGRVRVETQEDQFGYSVTVDTKTRGLAKLFDRTTSVATVRGKIVNGEYIPTAYDSHSRDDEDGAHTTAIRYDEEGHITSRDRQPPSDPNWRPIVPLEEANSAIDPITAFIRIRRMMHDRIAANIRESSIRTYEGARLAEFTLRVVSKARSKMGDDYVDTINIVPKRALLNGYTPKEIKKFKEKGDPTIHLYFSADARFIPLQADIDLPFGTLSAQLTESE